MTDTIQQDAPRITLTRTQIQFFQSLAEQSVRASFESVEDPAVVEKFIEPIHFKQYGKHFGETMLSRVSYSDVKAVDKFMKSEQFINVMAALEEAVDTVPFTEDDALNTAFTASFILDTVSPVLAPEEYAAALASTDKPMGALEKLLSRAVSR
ncbi:hypothetical protein ATI02_5979 [Pseudomonas baetica]|uniref:Uncharacterized protein n=1 Tax=Pseudomonas baetica TaxID=674054 RepID=A0ABX4Q7W2_9PSED|nr:hypothetical protein [Pseudomonas baetica]PKA72878.1 hypothetical protein ATI02_5979 [Pseudomonas baetica]PTC19031.1 hypothetical protein C0J26_11360 [Pseudomonas baetica]